jgi:hypothetical protein
MKRISLLCALIIVFSLLSAIECAAGPITFGFTGTVTSIFVFPTYNPPPSDVIVGAAVHGSYTFESTAPDANPVSFVGDYISSGPPYGFGIQVGSLSIFDDFVRIFVLSDSYQYPQYSAGGPFQIPGYSSSIALTSPTGPVFATDSQPLTPPNLSSFANRYGNIRYAPVAGLGTNQGYIVSFSLDSLTASTAAPEPASLALLALGIGAGALLFYRRN